MKKSYLDGPCLKTMKVQWVTCTRNIRQGNTSYRGVRFGGIARTYLPGYPFVNQSFIRMFDNVR